MLYRQKRAVSCCALAAVLRICFAAVALGCGVLRLLSLSLSPLMQHIDVDEETGLTR